MLPSAGQQIPAMVNWRPSAGEDGEGSKHGWQTTFPQTPVRRPALLGDIGRDQCAFRAAGRKSRISKVAILDVADYSGPCPAMEAFLGRHCANGVQIDHACLAIAGWIEEGRATTHWPAAGLWIQPKCAGRSSSSPRP